MAVDSLPYGSVNDKVGTLYFTFLIHSYTEYVAVDSLPYGSVSDKVGTLYLHSSYTPPQCMWQLMVYHMVLSVTQ